MRDVENTLADALGAEAALSKSTVSRVCQAIAGEFSAWTGDPRPDSATRTLVDSVRDLHRCRRAAELDAVAVEYKPIGLHVGIGYVTPTTTTRAGATPPPASNRRPRPSRDFRRTAQETYS